MTQVPLRVLAIAACLSLHAGRAGWAADETTLFDFAKEGALADWAPAKLPEVKTDQPAPKIEVDPETKGIKITFDAGDWPVVGTATPTTTCSSTPRWPRRSGSARLSW